MRCVEEEEGTVLPSVLVTRVTLGRGLSVPLAREKEKRSVISYLPRPAYLDWKGAGSQGCPGSSQGRTGCRSMGDRVRLGNSGTTGICCCNV
ncbi:hypothetical protein CEXT_453051 [Caerostris extrusa]|uniref:Uncharacterized protein n=1 Tax=Caerostris extrusa TaxID=172846 RepID=A0AAV4XU34_CAEEX|nr:hypothetical protein CEXT_453051 [Caerostris extrusa]